MYRIVWTTRALKQLQDILYFVTNLHQSTSFANKLLEEIKITEQYIITQNISFVKVEDTSQDIHKAVVLKNYSMFYSVSSDDHIINIVCFWDNRQDPKELKKAL